MKDRFDLEQEILRVYGFSEDVDDLVEYIMNKEVWPVELQDEICNVLVGLSTRLKIHSEKMMDTTRQVLKLDQYAEADVPSSELTLRSCDCCDRTAGLDPVW